MRIFAFLFAVLAIPTINAKAMDLSKEQADVWKQEEAYWDSVTSGDVSTFLELWDSAFIGWPCDSPRPVNNDGAEQSAETWFSDVKLRGITHELHRQAVIVSGDTAISYYSVRESVPGESGVQNHAWFKFIHTWKRQQDVWLITGGMRAPLDADS